MEEGRDNPAAQRLSRLVRPFLLRRRKTDPGIAPELPPKTETDHLLSLTSEQAALYQRVVQEVMAEIRSSTTEIARRGLVLKLLVGLKQVCNHPAHYLKEAAAPPARSEKLQALDELLSTILAEGGAVLVFTQYVQMARLLEGIWPTAAYPPNCCTAARQCPSGTRWCAGSSPVRYRCSCCRSKPRVPGST